MYATRRHIRHFWNADDEGISWRGHCRLLVSRHMHLRAKTSMYVPDGLVM